MVGVGMWNRNHSAKMPCGITLVSLVGWVGRWGLDTGRRRATRHRLTATHIVENEWRLAVKGGVQP